MSYQMRYQVWRRDIIHRPNGQITYSKPYIVSVERGEEE